MPQEMTQEEFLKDLEPKNTEDPLTAPLTPEAESTPVEDTPEDKGPNRRERRLQEKLTAEREASIALAAKLEALTEAQRLARDTSPTSYEEKAMRIYGNDTPEAAAASELLVASLREVREAAKQEALAAIREEQSKAVAEEAKEGERLESMLDEIEDDTGFTFDDTTRRGFFQLLERMSPKDRDGNITEYADHNAVFEMFQAQMKNSSSNNRAKTLASRSMTSSGASPESTLQDNSTERFLKEQGII